MHVISSPRPLAAVLGAGVIGLAVARRLALSGKEVNDVNVIDWPCLQ